MNPDRATEIANRWLELAEEFQPESDPSAAYRAIRTGAGELLSDEAKAGVACRDDAAVVIAIDGEGLVVMEPTGEEDRGLVADATFVPFAAVTSVDVTESARPAHLRRVWTVTAGHRTLSVETIKRRRTRLAPDPGGEPVMVEAARTMGWGIPMPGA